ncbi:MAG: MoaD/ThiS family protein [Hyphomonas sp.]
MAGKLLFFGKLADLSGTAEWPMPAFDGTLDRAALIARIAGTAPDLAGALAAPTVRLCINQEILAPGDAVAISPGDEVAFLPPMSGG